jgi:hypothetical protein
MHNLHAELTYHTLPLLFSFSFLRFCLLLGLLCNAGLQVVQAEQFLPAYRICTCPPETKEGRKGPDWHRIIRMGKLRVDA